MEGNLNDQLEILQNIFISKTVKETNYSVVCSFKEIFDRYFAITSVPPCQQQLLMCLQRINLVVLLLVDGSFSLA